MKTQVKMLGVAFFFALGSMAFTSCGEAEVTTTTPDTETTTPDADADAHGTEPTADAPEADAPEAEAETTSSVMYQCPDNCQEGRAFFEPGKCKGCDKDLVEI